MSKLSYTRLIISSAFKTAAAGIVAVPAFHYAQGNLTLTPLPGGLHTDAIIALTGKEDRIPLAFDDFISTQSQKFFISGMAEQMNWPAHFPIDQIGQGAIFVDTESKNTIDNGFYTAQWMKDHHINSAVFRTSANHGLRSHFEIHRLLPDNVTLYFEPTSEYQERAFPDTEKMRLLCRMYETMINLNFCYAARDWWNDSSGYWLRFQHTPPVIADGPDVKPG